MSDREDHQHLEADRLALGTRAAREMRRENMTRMLRSGHVAHQRKKAIRARVVRLLPLSQRNPPKAGGKRHRLRENLIRRLARRDGAACWWCGVAFDATTEPTIDHEVPTSAGGADSFDNKRLACERCNGDRGGVHGTRRRSWPLSTPAGMPSRPKKTAQ